MERREVVCVYVKEEALSEWAFFYASTYLPEALIYVKEKLKKRL